MAILRARSQHPQVQDSHAAIALAKRAVEQQPKSAEFYEVLAYTLASDGQYAQAVKFVRIADKLAKQSGELKLERRLKRQLGHYSMRMLEQQL